MSLPNRTREHLIQLADKVVGVVPIDSGSFRVFTRELDPNIVPKTILDELALGIQKDYTFLYYIRAVNNPNLIELERVFSEAKVRNPIAYARWIHRSDFLYVGSSANPIQRFKEHLGYGSVGTYSMQLAHWASNLNLELDFMYASYPASIPQDVIQALEDTLWDTLRPMFGRKGQR